MGRDPKIVQLTKVGGDILFLSYVRPIDNFVWETIAAGSTAIA
jgi:hypothetical protein